jgi:hypothetical protein
VILVLGLYLKRRKQITLHTCLCSFFLLVFEVLAVALVLNSVTHALLVIAISKLPAMLMMEGKK